MDTRFQLNGLVLLYAYLQRVFVHAKVSAGEIPEPTPDLLDVVGTAIQSFDQDAGLSDEERRRLLGVTDEARSLMRAHLPRPDAELPDQLASVAATLYAEEHVNNGIVHMGELYDPEVADRFRARIPYYRDQVAVITDYVGKAADGVPLTREENAQLDSWFAIVTGSVENIELDFRQIESYLAA